MDSDSENEYDQEDEYDEEEEHFLDIGDGDDDGEEEAGEEEEEEEDDEGDNDGDDEEEDSARIDPSSAGLKRFRKMKALVLSKYASVWDTTEILGWKAYRKGDARAGTCNLCWTDSAVSMSQIMKMKRMHAGSHLDPNK